MSSSSKYNNKSPPLYPSTERFNPLGFSTPQQQRGSSLQARKCLSAQPNHMLPRPRGFHNRQRGGHNEYHNRSYTVVREHASDTAESQGNLLVDADRQNYNRNWKTHQNRNGRFGGQRNQRSFRPLHQAAGTPYNINDYFHLSMLEDPWEFLLRKGPPSADRKEHANVPYSTLNKNIHTGDSSNSAEEG